MKKFLLIIAVATVGFLPQLAFCDAAQNLVDSMKAVTVVKVKAENPGVPTSDVVAALDKKSDGGVAGEKGHWQTVTLKCGLQKREFVDENGNKILQEDRQAGGRKSAGEAS